MRANFGEHFKLTIFGESHGAAIGIVIDGLPAGAAIDEESIARQMARRAPGNDPTATARKEADAVRILSGVRDGRATLLDGTIAGSSSNLLQELRNVVSYGVPLEAAVRAATETPAKDIGVFDSIGSLDVGKCADFLVLNKDLKLMATFIDGRLVNGTTDFESVK